MEKNGPLGVHLSFIPEKKTSQDTPNVEEIENKLTQSTIVSKFISITFTSPDL